MLRLLLLLLLFFVALFWSRGSEVDVDVAMATPAHSSTQLQERVVWRVMEARVGLER